MTEVRVLEGRRWPFAQVKHIAIKALHAEFEGRDRAPAMALYMALCALESAGRAHGTPAFQASRSAIAKWAGVSTKTLDRYVPRLEVAGLLSVERVIGRGHSNVWALTDPPEEKATQSPLSSEGRQAVANSGGKGDSESPPVTVVQSSPTGTPELKNNGKEARAGARASTSETGQQVFDEWVRVTGRTDRTVFTTKRQQLVARRLEDYPLEDLLDAVRGWRRSKHHCGHNEDGTVYNDLELVLREDRIEFFRDRERAGGPIVLQPQRHGTEEGECPLQIIAADELAQLDAWWATVNAALHNEIPEARPWRILGSLHPHRREDGRVELGAPARHAGYVADRYGRVLGAAAKGEVRVVPCAGPRGETHNSKERAA